MIELREYQSAMMDAARAHMRAGRKCAKCGQFKEWSEFYPKNTGKNGKTARCRACISDANRESHTAHRPSRLAAAKVWRAANLEIKRASHKTWKAANRKRAQTAVANWKRANRERVNASAQRRRLANIEFVRAKAMAAKRARRLADPEKVRAADRTYARARRIKRPEVVREYERRRLVRKRAAGAIAGHHTTAEWLALLEKFGGKCALCGTKEKLTRDHVMPLSKGGADDIGNIQPLCVSCNSRKGARMPL
jgi:5-methylcytosine-specific restriction endonuclease McrA